MTTEMLKILHRSEDSSAGIGMGYKLDGKGSFAGKSKRFFSSPHYPYRLWGPHSLLSNGYRSSFPEGEAAGA
jgi:hypothetical protein